MMTNDQRLHLGIGALLACFSTAIVAGVFREGRLFVGLVGEGFCWGLFILYCSQQMLEDRDPPRMRLYSVAKEFSRFPAGRTRLDGPYSGEALREILIPLLKEEGALAVDLNGTMGYGSSWLEGCFLDLEALAPIDHLVLICDDDSIIHECWDYIRTKTATATKQRHLNNEEAERRFPERRS